ncbi:amidohydrolase family protein [Rhizobium leguminosarum]|uniref:amidohydrolase family protein n=1 Tax=Rhizobium leguminosarum TaxID=384 RepID=UPI003F9D9312
MLRRAFLRQSALFGAALSTGCTSDDATPTAPGKGQPLIDAHCHLFNASDLPPTRFLRQVVFENYPEQSFHVMGVWDPDAIDVAIELALRLLGTNTAPDADQEIRVLTNKAHPERTAANREQARQAAIEDMAGFLLEIDRRSRNQGPATMGTAGEHDAAPPESGETKFLDFVIGGKPGTARASAVAPLTMIEARAASARAFVDLGMFSRYLEWFSLFRLYRHVLVDQLVADARRQGFEPVMLTPLLVDYDEWLFEDVRTPLAKQMEVMDYISRRSGDRPAVHGYIGFDPLREVAFRANIKGTVSSLVTSRRALTEHGFVGVKLYPPMGFRPSGNHKPYPKRTEKRLGFRPDKQLDQALDDLYKLCVDLDAPIMAHGYSSNGSGRDYADRGDPAYWLPVFHKYPSLRVCIAHFGRFDARSAGRTQPFPDGSWEWTLGEFIRANPRQPVFADISYFSEALEAESKRAPLARYFRRWVGEFDPEVNHLVFGTDWIMLGKEKGYSHYIESVNSFLRQDCGFGDDVCDKIFRGNALRLLPLQRWSKGRERLLAWYRRNGVDPKRLPISPSGVFAGLVGD